MSNIKTYWKQSGKTDAYSLYVNDQKTNIYFFPPTYKHFNFMKDGKKGIREAVQLRKLIQKGEIKPEDGNWNNFDQCYSHHFLIDKIVFLDKRPEGYMNKIKNVTMYTKPDKQHVIDREVGRKEFTQYINRIINGKVSNTVGCYLDNYGYSLYFI